MMDTFFTQTQCDRCHGDLTSGRIMSMFNTECLCMQCAEQERQDREYNKAAEADHEHIRQGNYNFRGIRG
jgi:hypothetical protein